MTAAALKVDSRSNTTPKPSAIEVFRERREARAILVEACLFDLQDAVDGLQAAAVASGLVDEIGQDEVQRMMAVPNFPAGGKIAKPRGAAALTLKAADYLVQQKDPARLKAWLIKHTRAERDAIIEHIRRTR